MTPGKVCLVEETLDCDTCGAVVMRLTEAEAQRVADRPYAYIVFCTSCRRAEIERTGQYYEEL